MAPTPFLKDPPRLAAAILFVVALVGFTVYAAANGNSEFLFYAGTMVVMAAVVFVVDRFVHLSLLAIYGLLAWAILHLAGGNVPVGEAVLYNYRPAPMLPKYDQVTHAFGFAIATLVCWECLRHAISKRTNGRPRPSFGLVVACVLMGIGLGALNEVIEFVAVLTMPDTNVGGYTNTGWDLVSNLTGAAIMGVFIRLRG
ncbi:MAG: DUF2238 domain-containing protein [Phycisphaerales bacterium JB064]